MYPTDAVSCDNHFIRMDSLSETQHGHRESNGSLGTRNPSINQVPEVNFKDGISSREIGNGRVHSNDKPNLEVPQNWQAVISVGILCFINLINYMDRFTVAGVLKQVKTFYGINNTMGGLLQTVFIISYMLLAPLFGYLGDRYSRKVIITFGIFFWSSTTLAGSFIPSDHFWAFIFLRAMVGIGEASYSTLAPTIISDLFVGKQRSRMLTVFYFAIPVGSGLGYIVGSNVAKAFGSWQWSLRVTPGLGILAIVLLHFFLKEPPHGESEGGAHLKATDWKTDLKSLSKNLSFVWSTAGFTCVAFVVGSLAWWAPIFMSHSYAVQGVNKSESSVDLIFGGITCFAGIIGVALGYTISSTLKKKFANADPLVCGIGMLVGTPFLFAAAIMANKCTIVSWVLICIGEILFCMNWPLVADILLYVVIPTRRGMAEAVQMVASHALGDAISPYIIGTISDEIQHGKTPSELLKFHSLQYALFTTTFVSVIGGLFFLFSALYIVKDKEKATAITRGNNDESSAEDMTPVVINTDDLHPLIT